MFNSDDFKKDNKHQYSKNEYTKINISNYLQKRKYTSFQPTAVTKTQLHLYSSVENEISNPNSIRYRCYNCDPVIIDNNFSKFLNWLRESMKDEFCTEIEQLIGPFFCHLYLDILQGGHPEKAAAFFLAHLSNVEKVNSDLFIQDLINSLSGDNQTDYHRQEFRSNKYVVQISEYSKKKLMNFVAENCHVIFLQVLQTWFEIEVMNSQIVESESDLIPNECCLNSKFQKIINASAELENDQNKLVYSINISNVIFDINCGLISRFHGFFVYNQENTLCIQSLHMLNNLSSISDSMFVRLNGHSKKILALTISKNYLASASSDGRLCIYKNEEFEIVSECPGHIRSIYCLKISNNEFYLASGSEDNTIRLWNLTNGQFLRVFVGHEQAIICLDFHPNCLYIMSGSSDNSIRMWNIETATPLRLMHGSQGTIRAVACNPLGRFLVSASDDRYLKTWDLLTGKIILETKLRDAFVTKLQWSNDGVLLCGALSDNTIKIWNYKNFENSNIKSNEVLQTVHCPGVILNLEYCFCSFGVLTTK